MTAPVKPNAELAYRVLDHIDAHPEQWEQGVYIGKAECGTVACFAGWACLLSGEKPQFPIWGPYVPTATLQGPDMPLVPDVAEQLLRASRIAGIDEDGDQLDLFDADNTREDLGRMVAEIFGPRPGGPEPVALDYDDVAPNAGSAS